MSSIELYWIPGTCARVPFVALEEIGAPYEVHVINRWRGEQTSDAYRAVNPKLKVPVIVLDGWAVTENPVILRLLAERFPDARLLPAGDERTAVEAQSMLAWFASELHRAVGRQRVPQNTSPDEAAWDGIRRKAREDLEKSFALLEQRLDGREWLFDDWSVADVYMDWLWFRAVGSGMDATAFPRCIEHGARVEARPSVAAVLDREESEFARFEREGVISTGLPPYQVGRLPAALLSPSGADRAASSR